MNLPLFKLHMDASGKKINENNAALNAEEAINLRVTQLNEKSGSPD